ncbi:hypothetical protein D3C71_2097660 [compost metagenome]
MDVAGVHQHHGTGCNFEGRALMQVGAASGRDCTDGEMLVGMPGVTDFSTIGDGACLDEGQGIIAPEARGRVPCLGLWSR